ncbi:MAG TPA: hypothetical protein VFF93_01060 [Luteimonas sp.]|jgi:hypothetical protein|nr:hypothetical protein [Luteimonas sp.]
MTIRTKLLGIGLALTAGSAFALPPLPPPPPLPPSPGAVAHRVQSDVDRAVDRVDGRSDRDAHHDRGHHYARGHRHHHRKCVRRNHHGTCKRWSR